MSAHAETPAANLKVIAAEATAVAGVIERRDLPHLFRYSKKIMKIELGS
jgi:hypothetical protein